EIPPDSVNVPVPPTPLGVTQIGADDATHFYPLLPTQLSYDPADPYFYGTWAAKFQVSGLEPPPEEYVTVAKSIAVHDDNGPQANDVVRLPDGYEAAAVDILVNWWHSVPTTGGDDSQVDIAVGNHHFHFGQDQGTYQAQWGNNFFGA